MISLLAVLMAATGLGDPERNCYVSALKKECREPATEPRQDGASRSIKLKPIPLQRKLTLPGQDRMTEQHCTADFEVSYVQMNDRIRVDTRVDTDKCDVAGGQYSLRVRTYIDGEAGPEPVTRTMTEQWQRSTPGMVEQTTYYPMDGVGRLGWVRIDTDPVLACLCAEPVAAVNE